VGEHEVVLDALSELKAELKAQHMTLSQVLDQARKTNGRITMLEDWRHMVELKQAHEQGMAEGAGTAAITKGQLRMFIASATAIASIAGTVAGIIVRFMG